MQPGKPRKAPRVPIPSKKKPFSQFKVSGKGNDPTGMSNKKNPMAPMTGKRLSK